MPKIKLIYILGFGHSGSTMLDLILGAMPETESTGEIIRLRKELDWNHPCTCGELLKDCSYWTPILEAYEGDIKNNPDLTAIPDPYEFIKVLRQGKAEKFFQGVFKGSNENAPSDLVSQYSIRTKNLFNQVLNHTKANVIVDSSKNHRRLILLWLSGLFDIKVVFLYRNSPELIQSLKRRMQTEFKEVMDHNKNVDLDAAYVDKLNRKLNRKASLKDIAKYVFSINRSLKNKLRSIDYLRSRGFENKDLVFINYRDIVQRPNEAIQQLCSDIGITFNPDVLDFDSEKYFLKEMGHNMGGNFMRKKGPKPIVAQEVKALSPIETLVNKLLGGYSADKIFQKISKRN